MSIRTRTLAVAAALAGVILCGIAAPHSMSFSSLLRASAADDVLPPRDALIDFNGNDVRPAVANYKVDPTGAVYEEHSPDTEVPRLGPPKG